ncbi:HAD-IA family hydrolase [uncultured Jatrophihabitans sp.]|uniref:HAD-IA family hydrolase n=1 Tax=uncultured Jatrophihabitans sp. TaxID=1610747 RepID=UPI0035CA0D18
MSALFFGSISTIADTSELQRQAFNEAFTSHGLDWSWDRDDYREQLTNNGGAKRIAEFAAARGEDVDAAAVHRTKSETFQKLLGSSTVTPRPGVAETIRIAKGSGHQVALVTTTTPENVAALLEALKGQISRDDFDLVVDLTSVDEPKPDRAAYSYAMRTLDVQAEDCVAVEDNVGGVASAVAAGVVCVAFPNENTAGHDFAKAAAVVDHIDFEELRTFIKGEQ